MKISDKHCCKNPHLSVYWKTSSYSARSTSGYQVWLSSTAAPGVCLKYSWAISHLLFYTAEILPADRISNLFSVCTLKIFCKISFSAASLIRFLLYTAGIDWDNEYSRAAYIAFSVHQTKTMLECMIDLPCVKAGQFERMKMAIFFFLLKQQKISLIVLPLHPTNSF